MIGLNKDTYDHLDPAILIHSDDSDYQIKRIRQNLPIIAQTAFIFEDDKDIILEAGCDACLIKPIRKEHLLTVMSSFLKS